MQHARFFKGLFKRSYHNFTNYNLSLPRKIIGILPTRVDPDDEVRISALVATKKMPSLLSFARLERK